MKLFMRRSAFLGIGFAKLVTACFFIIVSGNNPWGRDALIPLLSCDARLVSTTPSTSGFVFDFDPLRITLLANDSKPG